MHLKFGIILESSTVRLLISNEQVIKVRVVDSHGDHRLAMAFSLIGLKHDIQITNGEVYDVSFPNFIEAMSELGFELELVE